MLDLRRLVEFGVLGAVGDPVEGAFGVMGNVKMLVGFSCFYVSCEVGLLESGKPPTCCFDFGLKSMLDTESESVDFSISAAGRVSISEDSFKSKDIPGVCWRSVAEDGSGVGGAS